MTYDEKLEEIAQAIGMMAKECVDRDDMEIAHTFTGLALQVGAARAKVHEYGIDEQEFVAND